MSKPINNFKLGLFSLVGVALLIAGILAFGARSYFEPTSLYETYVSGDVTGLAVGSAVELRGVKVGKVSHIDFSWIEYEVTQPSYIVVVFEMRKGITPGSPGAAQSELLDAAIRRGLRARVKARGVTGTSILSIEYVNPDDNPPAQVPWTPKNTYIPSAPAELGALLASLEKTMHGIENLDFNAMNRLLLADMKSAGQLLDKAGQFDFGIVSTNANALLTELRGSNRKLQSLVQDTDDTVKKMELEKLSRHFDGLVSQLQDTVARLEPGVANIDFNALNQTLANARQTVQDMDDVLADLKQYPSGFLFGNPPAPVKGIEPTGKP
jgi:ABC-type transporter Mla subunit MlaD